MSDTKPVTPGIPITNIAPAHYQHGGIEVMDFLEAYDLDQDFCLGNTVKYIARAGKKDPSKLIEDLEKAEWYLKRKIANLKKNADRSV